jgi:hypothetical protein
MLHERFVCLSLAGLAIALAAAGCGGSAAVTGEGAAPSAAGSAVVQGTVTGASAGVQVGAVGTPLVAPVDDDGQFALAGLPAGTATLRFEGAGLDARVPVPGLQDGQVTSITVHVSGGTAQLTGTPSCTPTAETFFSGVIDSIAGSRLVVAGRAVDASEVEKVWRGERRIPLSDLQVGEKVKVWGTLRGDGVVLAEEIAALTAGPGSTGETWVSFRGKVESVAALDAAPGVRGSCVLRMKVAGRDVKTNASTVFRWSDGSDLDPYAIVSGDRAYVEGWSKPEGYVLATRVVVDKR